MKKTVLCLLLSAVMLLSACQTPIKRVTPADTGFTDPETGITYLPCAASLSVRPLNVEEEFATDGTNTYYSIRHEETSRFLCDYVEAGAAFVFRAEGVEDITIANFKPISALIYAEGKTSVYIDTFYCAPEFLPEDKKDLAGRDDSALVYAIRDAMIDGESVNVTYDGVSEDDIYYIRLLSAEYPGLYYIAVFFEAADGFCYIADRSTGKCVVSPASVKARMVG